MPHHGQPGMQQQDLTPFAAVVTGFPSHCFHSNRGLIVLRSNCSYVLEPLPDSPDQHRIYRLDDLRMPAGACGHRGSMATDRNWLGDFAAGVKFPNHRVRRALSGSQLTAVTPSRLEESVCDGVGWLAGEKWPVSVFYKRCFIRVSWGMLGKITCVAAADEAGSSAGYEVRGAAACGWLRRGEEESPVPITSVPSAASIGQPWPAQRYRLWQGWRSGLGQSLSPRVPVIQSRKIPHLCGHLGTPSLPLIEDRRDGLQLRVTCRVSRRDVHLYFISREDN